MNLEEWNESMKLRLAQQREAIAAAHGELRKQFEQRCGDTEFIRDLVRAAEVQREHIGELARKISMVQ